MHVYRAKLTGAREEYTFTSARKYKKGMFHSPRETKICNTCGALPELFVYTNFLNRSLTTFIHYHFKTIHRIEVYIEGEILIRQADY